MRTLRMPAAVHETSDTESALEMLDQCCKILRDYREEGCPGFPGSEEYVEALMAIGVTCAEAVDLLARTLDNYEEKV